MEQALEVAEAVGKPALVTARLDNLARIHVASGDDRLAELLLERSRQVAAQGHLPWFAATATVFLAEVVWRQGRRGAAAALLLEALLTLQDLDDAVTFAGILDVAGLIALDLDHPELATRLVAAATIVTDRIGTARSHTL